MATPIAAALNVSLDYLVGNSDLQIDKPTLERIQAIQQLPDEEKKQLIDYLICF